MEDWRVKPCGTDCTVCVNTIKDLLNISWNYTSTSYDWFRLFRLIPALTELDRLVGMEDLKKDIVNLVLYYIQQPPNVKNNEMLHTVIYGDSGVGKTTVAKIIAKIYYGLGFLDDNEVIIVKRSDLVGKYIGHSEDRTIKILNSAKNKVLFIDEAYSMGNIDRTDSFSKASVDIINQYLSENKDFVCIIAGYEKELDECFFSINPGLRRRFPWSFHIQGYTPKELCEMFYRKVRSEGYTLLESYRDQLNYEFDFNKRSFQYHGGDIDNLFSRTKIEHMRRIFGTNESKTSLTVEDVIMGIGKFKKVKDRECVISSMYM